MKKYLSALAITFLTVTQVNAFTLTSDTQNIDSPKYTVNQSQSFDDTFTINNMGNNPIDLYFEVVDGFVSQSGTRGYKVTSENSQNLGNWAKFTPERVTLKPKEKAKINLSINIPETATPGSYLGGISMTNIKPETNENSNTETPAVSGAGTSVEVKTRFVNPIYLTIPGEITNKFSVSTLSYNPKNSSFFFYVNNEGNTLLRAKGDLVLTNKSTGQTVSVGFLERTIQRGGNSIVNIKTNLNREYFGFFNAKANIQLEYYNGVEDKFLPLSTETLEMDIDIIPWQDIILCILILITLISSIIFKKHLDKQYLNSCSEYTVKEGETLAKIAEKHKMSWKKLAKINKLSPPYDLKPGIKLLVHKSK